MNKKTRDITSEQSSTKRCDCSVAMDNVQGEERFYRILQCWNRLVVELAIEWQADGLEEQARVLVARCICYDGDVASRYHFGWVSINHQHPRSQTF